MTGMIQQRETFLANIAKQLGRSPKTELPRPTWQYQPQDRVLKDATKDELVEILIDGAPTFIPILSFLVLPHFHRIYRKLLIIMEVSPLLHGRINVSKIMDYPRL